MVQEARDALMLLGLVGEKLGRIASDPSYGGGAGTGPTEADILAAAPPMAAPPMMPPMPAPMPPGGEMGAGVPPMAQAGPMGPEEQAILAMLQNEGAPPMGPGGASPVPPNIPV